MASPKARYTGDGSGALVKDFSDTLKARLRGYYPDRQAEPDPTWGHPADNFVLRVLAAARSAIAQLHWQQFESTKQDIRAEHADFIRSLKSVHHKLTNLSPDYERLLGVETDNLGCADLVQVLIRHVEAAACRIEDLPTAKRPAERQRETMLEMSIGVLRCVKDFGIAASATGSAYFDYTSDAVQILKAIGDDIGLARDDLTWRDIIGEAKKSAPDI